MLTGADGLLPALLKEALERGLQAELTDHLGYEKGEPTKAARGNARGGTTTKMIDSEVGTVRDLWSPGTGAARLRPAWYVRASGARGGLDSMIVSLYAGGMTVRETPAPPGDHPGCGAVGRDDQ
ncbi:transposase [Actinomyces succiniciruminis]|uniref:Transposase, Mutator family n=1 Tax=Actinomyces succiniciruminis TaxID=1522002 RepID=A0A1L7RNN5_9ACTO|nr:transposase [Actinomyces succiniciruminis]CED90914.1 Transposase, Mutator family [Actinomyces succiniciruminis]